jgi:hypothetical protein
MSLCLYLQIDRPKKLLILSAIVCCVTSHILLFNMGMHECLEKILTWAKWKWEHECNISSFRCSNTFTLQFGLVWSSRMCWKFFPCSCLKLSWSGLFSFGDMNNAPKCLAKFPLGLIITSEIWNKWTTLWNKGLNIIDWQWICQSIL